jgi:hypothetical protein
MQSNHDECLDKKDEPNRCSQDITQGSKRRVLRSMKEYSWNRQDGSCRGGRQGNIGYPFRVTPQES